jgi:uncharacterized protein (DUF111 family)
MLLGVIAKRQDETALADLILCETTTLGRRAQPIHGYEAQRDFHLAHIYGVAKVKQKIINGQVIQSIAEYGDCVRLVNESKVSLAEIYAEIYKNLE